MTSKARDAAIALLLPTARRQAKRFTLDSSRVSLDQSDLQAVAEAAVVSAVDDFESARGCELERFVRTRVRHALIDEIRRMRHGGRNSGGAFAEESGGVLWLSLNVSDGGAGGSPVDSDKDWGRLLSSDSPRPVEAAVEDRWERDALARFIDRLPERERRVMRMLTYEELSLGQVAQREGVTKVTVGRWVQRAQGRMKRYAEASGSATVMRG